MDTKDKKLCYIIIGDSMIIGETSAEKIDAANRAISTQNNVFLTLYRPIILRIVTNQQTGKIQGVFIPPSVFYFVKKQDWVEMPIGGNPVYKVDKDEFYQISSAIVDDYYEEAQKFYSTIQQVRPEDTKKILTDVK